MNEGTFSTPQTHRAGGYDTPFAQSALWQPGESGLRPLFSRKQYDALTYIEVSGPVEVEIRWGNTAGQMLLARAPLACTIPGYLDLSARPLVVAQVAQRALVSWRDAGSPTAYPARTVHTGAQAIADTAGFVTALDAVALTVAGIPVALVAGQRIAIVSPTALVAGSVVAEHLV